MGALFGLGIDNVLIELDNEEVPILDGSAKEFIEKIIPAGFEVCGKTWQSTVVAEPLHNNICSPMHTKQRPLDNTDEFTHWI